MVSSEQWTKGPGRPRYQVRTEAHVETHECTYLCWAGCEHSAVAQGQAIHILHQGLRSVVLPDVLTAAVVRVHSEPSRGLPTAAGSHLSLADIPCIHQASSACSSKHIDICL